jgi:hypothetical protein
MKNMNPKMHYAVLLFVGIMLVISPVMAAVTVYEHLNYGGKSKTFTKDIDYL